MNFRLRTRRTLSLHKFYGASALLVLNGTSLNWALTPFWFSSNVVIRHSEWGVRALAHELLIIWSIRLCGVARIFPVGGTGVMGLSFGRGGRGQVFLCPLGSQVDFFGEGDLGEPGICRGHVPSPPRPRVATPLIYLIPIHTFWKFHSTLLLNNFHSFLKSHWKKLFHLINSFLFRF